MNLLLVSIRPTAYPNLSPALPEPTLTFTTSKLSIPSLSNPLPLIGKSSLEWVFLEVGQVRVGLIGRSRVGLIGGRLNKGGFRWV